MRSFILRSIGEEEKEAEKEFEANFITRTVRSCQRQQSKEAKAEMQVRHRRGGLTKRRTASKEKLLRIAIGNCIVFRVRESKEERSLKRRRKPKRRTLTTAQRMMKDQASCETA